MNKLMQMKLTPGSEPSMTSGLEADTSYSIASGTNKDPSLLAFLFCSPNNKYDIQLKHRKDLH